MLVNRPLGLGELLDGAFRAYRAHFSRLVLIAALFLVPVGVVSTLLLGYTISSFGDLFTSPAGEAEFAGALPSAAVAFAYIGLGLLGYAAMSLAFVSLIAYAVALLQGEPISVGASLRRGLRRVLAFVGQAILIGLAVGGVLFVLYLGVALVFGLLTAFLGVLGRASEGAAVAAAGLIIFSVFVFLAAIFLVFVPAGLLAARWIAAPIALVAEALGPKQAMDRSWELTRGGAWRCFGYLVLLMIFNFVVLGLPVSLLQSLLLFAVDTEWYGWFSGLLTGLSYFVNILWYPIFVLALTLLYFDLRVRREGLDLDHRIRQLEQSVPPQLPPALIAPELSAPTRPVGAASDLVAPASALPEPIQPEPAQPDASGSPASASSSAPASAP